MPGPSAAALKKYQESFEKSFGKGSLETVTKNSYKVIPTGSTRLDRDMTTGGYVIGRITEVWGNPGGGKTSLSLIATGNAQRVYPDQLAGFIDVEGTFDPEWATTLGVDLSKLHIVRPDSAEEVADILKSMLESGFYSIITLDSIGAMIPIEEFEKDAGKVTVGTTPKIITRMVKIAAVYSRKYQTAVLLINQVRANIGFGGDTTTGGGWGLKHISSHKLQVKQSSSFYTIGSEEKKMNVGFEMGVKVERSKFGPSGRNAKFDFFNVPTKKYGPVGIDQVQDTFKVAVLDNIVARGGGGYYTFPNGEKIQGEDKAIEYLKSNLPVADELYKLVIRKASSEIVSDDLDQLTQEQLERLVDA